MCVLYYEMLFFYNKMGKTCFTAGLHVSEKGNRSLNQMPDCKVCIL